MFRSFRFFRIHSDWPADENALHDALANAEFKPCPPYSEKSAGFEPPLEGVPDLLCRRLSGADLVQLRWQSRVIPTAAVKEALSERIAEFERRTTRPPSRQEKRELKEEVYGELLPRALLKSDRIRAFYLVDEQILAIANSTERVAEELLEKLRDAFGSLLATPLEYKQSTQSMMKELFLGGDVGSFALGRECRMKDPSETSSSVSWFDMDIHDKSVQSHVKDGLTLDRLGLSWNAQVRFVMADDLVLRKVKFEGLEELDELEDDDPLMRHDAEFVLTSGLVLGLLNAFKKQLGGYVRI